MILNKIKYGFSMLWAELNGKEDYWHVREAAVLGNDYCPEIYYLDMKRKGYYPGEMEDGVPLFYLDGVHRTHFPITILNYGLGLFNRLHDGEDVSEEIQKVLRFILDSQCDDGAWRADIPAAVMHEMAGGKVSGMTQGLGISFLIRCWRCGMLPSSIDLADRLERAKDVMLSSSCVSMIDGSRFIEEFNVPGASILNGSMFALLGLYDYGVYKEDMSLFNEYESDLRTLLPRFDYHGWSYYSIQRTVCSKFYQQLHVDLLSVLYGITDCDIYNQYAMRWKRGLRFSFFFVFVKAFQKLLQVNRWSMNSHSQKK